MVLTRLPKPDEDCRRFLVYITHVADLITPLRSILLIDAYLVNPQVPASFDSFVDNIIQGICQVFGDFHGVIINENGNVLVSITPGVRKGRVYRNALGIVEVCFHEIELPVAQIRCQSIKISEFGRCEMIPSQSLRTVIENFKQANILLSLKSVVLEVFLHSCYSYASVSLCYS